MSSRLLGRIAIVTGASSGIGQAIALKYAAEGATVVCSDLQPHAPSDRNEKSATATHEVIIEKGEKAMFIAADVTDEHQVKALVAETVKQFERLDIMVNNAGVAPELFGVVAQPGGFRIHETQPETFDTTMKINTRGVFLGCKYAITQFLAQEPLPRNSRGDRTRGWIVNLASIAGLVAFGGAASYAMSKHAVVGLTKTIVTDTPLIALIIKDADNPIAIGTNQALIAAHPWGTLGQTEDVARAAVFLVSEDSQWINAQSLSIDGGYTSY